MRVEHIGDCTLYLGDCREVLPSLGKVDAVDIGDAVVYTDSYGKSASWQPEAQPRGGGDLG